MTDMTKEEILALAEGCELFAPTAERKGAERAAREARICARALRLLAEEGEPVAALDTAGIGLQIAAKYLVGGHGIRLAADISAAIRSAMEWVEDAAPKLTAGDLWYPENETSEDDCCDGPDEVVERNTDPKPGESFVMVMDRALRLPTVYAAVRAYTEEEKEERGDDEPWTIVLYATHEEAIRALAPKDA